jgi:macrodomain Ter protein organizer (MatP/YcbG family)
MIETTKEDLRTSLYGVTRLIAGWKDWKLVEDHKDEERISRLIEICCNELAEQSKDPANVDPKTQGQVMRKLRGYQQLKTLETFIFDEVEW